MRATWLALGLAATLACTAPGVASASIILQQHWGKANRPGDVTFEPGNSPTTENSSSRGGTFAGGDGDNTDHGADHDGNGGNPWLNSPPPNTDPPEGYDPQPQGLPDPPIPVPEPGTLALLGAGLAGLLYTHLRRRSARRHS